MEKVIKKVICQDAAPKLNFRNHQQVTMTSIIDPS